MASFALSNREEDALLKETKQEALKKCDDVVKDFAQCSSGRTVSVAWACRDQHRKLQDCLKQYTGPEAMEEKRRAYLKEHRQTT
ncbi:hypothetical protein FA10DRAFT_264565 [Acaromyces ingoldii]|uniref:COX assembly mitochondrial protein n=1 Tax=Acaromyces ingoldii TaxID=215250 RepID=A0A316YZ82_9BASI|nr:hypothetical protein FA10DRAFT_264565 [Acaromyces ingoldii]PWN93968.1 hypothetical protein FA10DRAFT_264565 [Acaromyces ingoldii]